MRAFGNLHESITPLGVGGRHTRLVQGNGYAFHAAGSGQLDFLDKSFDAASQLELLGRITLQVGSTGQRTSPGNLVCYAEKHAPLIEAVNRRCQAYAVSAEDEDAFRIQIRV